MSEGGGPVGTLDRFVSRNYVITSGPFVRCLGYAWFVYYIDYSAACGIHVDSSYEILVSISNIGGFAFMASCRDAMSACVRVLLRYTGRHRAVDIIR